MKDMQGSVGHMHIYVARVFAVHDFKHVFQFLFYGYGNVSIEAALHNEYLHVYSSCRDENEPRIFYRQTCHSFSHFCSYIYLVR